MQNWPSYECLKLPPKITRARKKRQGARLVENDNKVVVIDIRDVKGGSSATPRIINLRGCIHSKENNYPSRSLVQVAKPFFS